VSPPLESKSTSARPRWRVPAMVVLAIVAALGSLALFRGDADDVAEAAVYAVKRGTLPVRIVEGGSAESLAPYQVKCEVERGGIKIVSLVEEGYRITQADIDNKLLIVELDASELDERLVNSEIQYQTAKASLAKAEQDFYIQEKQNETDIKASEREVKFASLDLQKYLGEATGNRLIDVLERHQAVVRAAEGARVAHRLEDDARDRLEAVRAKLKEAEASPGGAKRKDLLADLDS